jgi:hypothetical protein
LFETLASRELAVWDVALTSSSGFFPGVGGKEKVAGKENSTGSGFTLS